MQVLTSHQTGPYQPLTIKCGVLLPPAQKIAMTLTRILTDTLASWLSKTATLIVTLSLASVSHITATAAGAWSPVLQPRLLRPHNTSLQLITQP